MARHRSSAAPLACLYAALIVYASLYPFTPWRIPGISPLAFLALPWPRYSTGFDLTSNLLGYLPLGALAFIALVRSGSRAAPAFVAAVGGSALLSLVLELAQNFQPQRVASNIDLGLNVLGALVGAALGWWLHALGLVDRWQAARDRWFIGRSAGGLALLLLWPVGLLFPLPVPLGQGQVLTHLQELVASGIEGTSAEAWLGEWLDAGLDRQPLSALQEMASTALGLLAPCLVAFAVSRRGWRRLLLVAGAVAVACGATTLSTALNFGPAHLLAWASRQALTALGIGAVLAAFASALPTRAAAAVGLIASTALIVLVSQAPADPYFAESLQGWEQGRFIRFHGAARWVGWLWPYAAIVYLVARVGAREAAPKMSP